MAAAADEYGGDSDKSRFRWLDAARYAVAAAVTVLILAVIVTAIKVLLRLDSLQISVDKGSIITIPMSPPEPEAALAFELQLRAQNPSGRVRMYYTNITAYLFDNRTSASASASASTNPGDDSVLYFKPKDIAVLQHEALDCSLHTNPAKKKMMDTFYFGMLYNGSRFSDMTLRLDGNLVTEVTSQLNKTRPTTYYCEQLLVGGNPNDDAFKYSQDVVCKQRRSAALP
ncbi:hypothetical protein BS78_10G014500 [Paspalum vaginatum]|nr:hypothetical protein BS78_10G014500 [Paspalum vaginatum]